MSDEHETVPEATEAEREKAAPSGMAQSIGGVIIAAGGVWFGVMEPDREFLGIPIGFLVALIGAGILDVKTFLIWRKTK